MQTGDTKPTDNTRVNSSDCEKREDISCEECDQRGSCKKCVIIPGATGPAGPRGPAGPVGPRGPAGPPGPPGEIVITATIPFSIAGSDSLGAFLSTDAQGDPEFVSFAGFGAPGSSAIILQPGDWDAGTITITDSTFYPSSFIMPFNGVLRNIYVLFANRNSLFLEDGVTMRPFVCLAVSNGGLVFTILSDTITYTEPYLGGEEIPKYSLRRGSLTNLNIAIAEGTLVGIVVGWIGEPGQSAQFSVSGGLFLE